MGGQDGFSRDLLEYETDATTLMAGVSIKPTERVVVALHASQTAAEASLDPFALPADDYVATHPSMWFNFSQAHTYSDIDTTRTEAQVSSKYAFSDSFWIKLKYHLIDFEDDAPYLDDTTGKVDFVVAALGWVF